ncbi:hypothetical protein [Kitasatospora sp. NBC_00458]|uniref:hypothetical protein n=1 Tax=Kitasatospora sp. NBC_00458 TaxID=2903568 RepID=UPI002E184495
MPGRKVFRVSGDSWLVEVWASGQGRTLCRITTAELVHRQEPVRAPQPRSEPPEAARKSRLWGRS